jgi:exosome complex exonuclease RRP6
MQPDSTDRVLAALRAYSEAIQQLPQGADYKYNAAYRGFPRSMKRHSEVIQDLMNRVSASHFSGRNAIDFAALPTPQSKHHAVVEAVDSLLESVDHLLDEVKGEKLKAAEQLQVAFGNGTGGSGATAADFATKVSRHLRPQLDFEVPVDNTHTPFRALLRDPKDGTLTYGAPGVHPYQSQLESLSFMDKQLSVGTETPPRPLDETPLLCVGTPEELDAAIEEMAAFDELAVDLEHHSFHSYQGFTCLAQFSTREKDYVVDTLALRSHMHKLNRVLTDPKIVKVLHSAHEDIKWFQKDFGCYVVNMFDTAIALQALHMPYSLAFLVDHFCQVKLDKTWQTADWRVRPLPLPMVQYARQDTHYLLYCYDRLRSSLVTSSSSIAQRDTHASQALGNLLVHVLYESRRRCLLQYVKDGFDKETTWALALGKSLGGLNQVQRDVAKFVFNWRDSAAREEDESPPAVLHTASVLTLATRLPVTARDVIRLSHPATLPLRRDAAVIASFISRALGEDGADDADATAAAEGAAPADEGAAAAATASRARHMIHRPMTGTLPSCEGKATSGLVRLLQAAPRVDDDRVRAAAAHPSPREPFLAALVHHASQPQCPARTLKRLAAALVPPGTHAPLPAAKQQAAPQRARAEADSDDEVRGAAGQGAPYGDGRGGGGRCSCGRATRDAGSAA